MYDTLLTQAARTCTVYVHDDLAPVTVADVERFAARSGMSQVPIVAHSSFDTRILASRRVARALLVDPAAAPELHTGRPLLRRRSLEVACPTYALEAPLGQSFVPRCMRPALTPRPPSGRARWTTYPLDDVGHVDMLDEDWVAVGRAMGIRGCADAATRARFRCDLASAIQTFAHGGVVRAGD